MQLRPPLRPLLFVTLFTLLVGGVADARWCRNSVTGCSYPNGQIVELVDPAGGVYCQAPTVPLATDTWEEFAAAGFEKRPLRHLATNELCYFRSPGIESSCETPERANDLASPCYRYRVIEDHTWLFLAQSICGGLFPQIDADQEAAQAHTLPGATPPPGHIRVDIVDSCHGVVAEPVRWLLIDEWGNQYLLTATAEPLTDDEVAAMAAALELPEGWRLEPVEFRWPLLLAATLRGDRCYQTQLVDSQGNRYRQHSFAGSAQLVRQLDLACLPTQDRYPPR